MPIRERRCRECDSEYEVLVLGSAGATLPLDGAGKSDGIVRCGACGSTEYDDVYNTKFAAVGLGGEAGVGKFYPYHDRALGPGEDGRGLLVRDAKHRDWLMTHEPSGRLREDRLIPLDTKTDSGTRGAWGDIAEKEAALNEEIDTSYNEMVDQIVGEQPEVAAAMGMIPPAPVPEVFSAQE